MIDAKINAKKVNTIIKLKHDTVCGSYRMTEIKRNIHWRDAMNIIMYTYNTNVYDVKKTDKYPPKCDQWATLSLVNKFVKSE